MTTWVVILADIAGSAGNITITCDWTSTVAELVDAWNIANPTNTLTIMWWDDTQIPNDMTYITLSHGYDNPTCQETDFMPYNKWLVLTRDDCDKTAKWMPPQCCLQEMVFTWTGVTLTSGSRDNTSLVCGTCQNIKEWASGSHCTCPQEYPLTQINTDNQKLTLTLDAPTSELLCLSRRHGGTLGVQVPDPDSCVDLININEHTWDLQGNLLYLLGSDGLVNSVVDLSQADRHTLWLVVNELSIYDTLWTLNNSVDLGDVNEQTLDLQWDILYILGSDGMPNFSVDLGQANQQTLTLAWNVLSIKDSNGWTTNHVDLDTIAKEILTISWWNMCVTKAVAPPNNCIECVNQCIDLSRINFTCEEVVSCVCDAVIDRTAAPYNVPLHLNTARNGNMDAARYAFFKKPRSFCAAMQFFQNIAWSWIVFPPTELIRRQRYWAKISMTDNCTMWSQHTAYSGDHNDQRNQRWFIPNFNKSEGRHAQNSSMISTADYGAGGPFEHHHEILPDAWLTWTCVIEDAIAPGTNFSKDFGSFYSQDPSINNRDNWVLRPSSMSNFCQNLNGYGCRTITIVYSGRYHVSLQWVLQVDHNVHAFRYSCLRYNSDTWKLDLLIDSKFGWGTKVGSASLNDPLVPRTNEYHWGWSKLVFLNAWDILFPAVKISPQTIWPKIINPWWEPTADILYELDSLGFPYGVHTWGSFTPWVWGWSFTPGHISYPNHPATVTIPTDTLAWPTANLPNVSPHFFSPTWWENWAERYKRNLMYQWWYNAGARNDYRYDDGVVTLYGRSSRWNSDGSINTEWTSEWASLSVHRVQKPQWDQTDFNPDP